ncbi:MAG: hypothetical protein GXP29_05370, partial [Planctomycetes bacterium]|nr:hypothetical protein [Planctomycetota bacterium]
MNRPSESADSVEPQGDSFGNLLTQVQSQQWNALAGTVAEASSLAAKPNDETSSPRRARIDQETQAARQAEVSSQRTRGADPTSVQNGVVSARHERVLSQQEAANEAMTAARAKTEQVESRDSRGSEASVAETLTKTKADSQVNRELERSAGPSREPVVNKPEQVAGQAGAKAASKPDLQTATPATSQAIAVSTAGAARISSVGQAPSSATSAEKIGQLLG